MTTMRLSDFMPYGAPELLEAARPNMVRALTLSSLLGVLLFAIAWSLTAWLGRPALPGNKPDHTTRVLLEVPPPPALKVEEPPPPVAPSRPIKAAAAVPVPVEETKARPDQTLMSQDEMRETAPKAAPSGQGVVVQPQSGEGPANLPGEVALVDQLPEPTRAPQPVYPELARQAHMEGLVIVYALVGKDGRVNEVQLHPKTNVPMLNDAALEAARKWSFQPAMQSGRPVSVWVVVPFRFKLH